MRRLKLFFSLPNRDKLNLVVASGLLLLISAGLVVCSFKQVRTGVFRIGRLGRYILPGKAPVERIAYSVDVADARLPGNRTCLVRSLSTEVLLRAYNQRYEHRIGVEKTDSGGIKAHSWIEHDGDVLIGYVDNLEQYERLPPLHADEHLFT